MSLMETASLNSSSSVTVVFGARLFYVIVTSTSCCIFLIINGTILFILRSKPMFTESPRYILLFNLVFADTVLIVQAQTLYVFATFHLTFPYTLCYFLAIIAYLSNQIAPLTLTVMSIERYIAVCFPFRHSTMVTLRNTGFAILLTWLISCVDTLTRLLLLLQVSFYQLPNVQMNEFCMIIRLSSGPTLTLYEAAYTGVLFTFSGLVVVSSFIGVMVVAQSASDKSSADKTRNTLLLHMFQLGLNLLSVLNLRLFAAISEWTGLAGVGRLYIVFYLFVILMPRCLSALTYGLRDSTLRPALGAHLCCTVRLRAGWVQVQLLVNGQRHKCHPQAQHQA